MRDYSLAKDSYCDIFISGRMKSLGGHSAHVADTPKAPAAKTKRSDYREGTFVLTR